MQYDSEFLVSSYLILIIVDTYIVKMYWNLQNTVWPDRFCSRKMFLPIYNLLGTRRIINLLNLAS